MKIIKKIKNHILNALLFVVKLNYPHFIEEKCEFKLFILTGRLLRKIKENEI